MLAAFLRTLSSSHVHFLMKSIKLTATDTPALWGDTPPLSFAAGVSPAGCSRPTARNREHREDRSVLVAAVLAWWPCLSSAGATCCHSKQVAAGKGTYRGPAAAGGVLGETSEI
jgi:hypothetical protein